MSDVGATNAMRNGQGRRLAKHVHSGDDGGAFHDEPRPAAMPERHNHRQQHRQHHSPGARRGRDRRGDEPIACRKLHQRGSVPPPRNGRDESTHDSQAPALDTRSVLPDGTARDTQVVGHYDAKSHRPVARLSNHMGTHERAHLMVASYSPELTAHGHDFHGVAAKPARSSRQYDSFVVRLWQGDDSDDMLRVEVQHVQAGVSIEAVKVPLDWILSEISGCLHSAKSA